MMKKQTNNKILDMFYNVFIQKNQKKKNSEQEKHELKWNSNSTDLNKINICVFFYFIQCKCK